MCSPLISVRTPCSMSTNCKHLLAAPSQPHHAPAHRTETTLDFKNKSIGTILPSSFRSAIMVLKHLIRSYTHTPLAITIRWCWRSVHHSFTASQPEILLPQCIHLYAKSHFPLMPLLFRLLLYNLQHSEECNHNLYEITCSRNRFTQILPLQIKLPRARYGGYTNSITHP